ncbi:MAG: transposase [Caldilineaceae bacterium]|nr:transposase [Caldilineaceae bacterium]
MQGHPRAYAGQEEKCRRVIIGVCFILGTGAQWRELPADLGKWNSVFKRYARWEENGVWADMFKQFAQDPDTAAVMPDSTTVRAHMCAAGGSKKGGVRTNSAQVGAGVASAERSISSSMRWASPYSSS